MNYNKKHNSESIKRELHSIVSNLKDPRLEEGFISISKIEITQKNSSCRIYISALKGYEFALNAVKCLNSAKGYIRKKLSDSLFLRYTPTLVFIPTNSIEEGTNILKKINNINKFENKEI